MKSYLFANELEHVAFCVINSAGLLDKTNLSLPISLSICQNLSFISDRMGNELWWEYVKSFWLSIAVLCDFPIRELEDLFK